MNLNQTDLDVIRDVVRATVSDEMRRFKDEIRAEIDKSYTREVIDLKLKDLRDQLDDLKQDTKENTNGLKNLWNNAAGRVIVIANGVLLLYALWQIIPH